MTCRSTALFVLLSACVVNGKPLQMPGSSSEAPAASAASDSAPPSNRSVEDRKSIQSFFEIFSDLVTKANATCGTKIHFEYDINSEPVAIKSMSGKYDPGWGYSVCMEIPDMLRTYCSGSSASLEKQAIQQKIQKVHCTFNKGISATIKGQSQGLLANQFTLQNGTLTLDFDNEGFNTGTELNEFLKKNL